MKEKKPSEYTFEDLSKKSNEAIREILGRYYKEANDRLQKIKDSGDLTSPAYVKLPAKIKEKGFSNRGRKARNQLFNDFKLVDAFMKDDTSKIENWQKIKGKWEREYNIADNERTYGYQSAENIRQEEDEWSLKQSNKFWQAYEKFLYGTDAKGVPYNGYLYLEDTMLKETFTSETLMKEVHEIMENDSNKTVNQLAEEFKKRAERYKSEYIKEHSRTMPNSKFFTVKKKKK